MNNAINDKMPPKISQTPPILFLNKAIITAGSVDNGPQKIATHEVIGSFSRNTNKAFIPIRLCQIPTVILRIISPIKII